VSLMRIVEGIRKTQLNVFVLFSWLFLFCSACAATMAVDAISKETAIQPENQPVRILFIGNSLTYYNELPKVLAHMVNSSQSDILLETDMVATGGATLESLWYAGEARKKISEGNWDYVVLQEQGSLGGSKFNGKPVINSPDLFHTFAKLFDREIEAVRAKTVLMLTWSSRRAPEGQAQLNHAYMKAARDLDAILVPLGLAWQDVIQGGEHPEMYSDGGHPSFAGTWLGAAVFSEQLLASEGMKINDNSSWCCVIGPAGRVKYGSGDVSDDHKALFRTAAKKAVALAKKLQEAPLPPAPQYAVLDTQAWLEENSAPNQNRDPVEQITGVWSGELALGPEMKGTLTVNIVPGKETVLSFDTAVGTTYRTKPLFWQNSPTEYRMYDQYTHFVYYLRRSDTGLVGVVERLLQQQDNSVVSTFKLHRKPE